MKDNEVGCTYMSVFDWIAQDQTYKQKIVYKSIEKMLLRETGKEMKKADMRMEINMGMSDLI